ncbi:proteasome regulatory subunit C-terminal-domain-containing protein [Gilbertella persicaria]|uniref:26S proteasome non-ATPase regulatory subunit n=1 Tax=Rhizopus stolonifer TaxID=4846 RepID=A0A367J1T2_RHIST|nr:proteasome regulatory subunit C-terminal-domain-containing protein [Gilbertella persicaria]KAI8070547.1 proteasome regulatory subunit C-terminal-domain-containing protein [Gilbertella persicaria]RCH83892.1 26S proteasome non-ATPase regulatory subunit [Rhizopus stolonifer]
MSQDQKQDKNDQVESMDIVEDEDTKQKRLTKETITELKRNFSLLERAVETIESRFTTRVLRTLPSIRRRLTSDILAQVITDYYTSNDAQKAELLHILNETEKSTADEESKNKNGVLPEVDVYVHLLVLIYLLDKNDMEKGLALSTKTVEKLSILNRRTLDQISARVYFYHARFHELSNKLADIRPVQLAAHRTATLRHDDESQATLLNLLLRNYFYHNLYDQADKLVSKSTFPEKAGNNQAARYAYYLGRIKALQLDYTSAHMYLTQAIRKAPQNNVTAGFQQTANKFFIVVQLLMGEIPERSLFRQPILKKALAPYLVITQAVRVGDLNKFQEGLAQYDAVFKKDKTYTLILRLRHNVIKTGIRMISLSYSKISLRDICIKLHLDSEEDAEFIVAKAIRDGVIDATLDHAKGFMKSKEIVDIYSTNEPQHAYHQRINFCLNLHNEAVKAMRFPMDAHRKELASAEEARERERELAQEIAEGELDEDDDMGDF